MGRRETHLCPLADPHLLGVSSGAAFGAVIVVLYLGEFAGLLAIRAYQQAQGQLSGALSRLLVSVEAYPQLQANQNFLALQSQLEGTENRIAIARRDYNEAVREYNTTLRTFPNVIWAKTVHAGAQPMQLFTATAEAQSAPQVNFNLGGPSAAPAAQPGVQAAPVVPGSPPPAR